MFQGPNQTEREWKWAILLWVDEVVCESGHDVTGDEDVEKLEADGRESDGGDFRNNETSYVVDRHGD